ncbi:MAG: GxxExxY protein [Ignavibacteriae bacterium]|nr:GxxExxY protein [Ignavibacteriota bacterium]
MNKYEEDNYKHSELTEKIIKEAYFVFNALGYGFLEKVYENALFRRLNNIGLKTLQQSPINVYFENELVGEYYADLIVEEKVIIELKAIQELNKIQETQLVNYLKATKIEVGLLINFGPKLDFKRKVFSNIHKKS